MDTYSKHLSFINKRLKTFASSLIREGYYHTREREDVIGELRLILWTEWHRYDKKRGDRQAFIYTILKRAASQLRSQRTVNRKHELGQEMAHEVHYVRAPQKPALKLRLARVFTQLTVPAKVLFYALQLQDRVAVKDACNLSRHQWSDMFQQFRSELYYFGIRLPTKDGNEAEFKACKPSLQAYKPIQLIGLMRLLKRPSFEYFERCPQQQVMIDLLITAYEKLCGQPFPWKQMAEELGLNANRRSSKAIFKSFHKKLFKQVAKLYEVVDAKVAQQPKPTIGIEPGPDTEQPRRAIAFAELIYDKMDDSAAMSDFIGNDYLSQRPEMAKAMLAHKRLAAEQMYFGFLKLLNDSGYSEEDLKLAYDCFQMDSLAIPRESIQWAQNQ